MNQIRRLIIATGAVTHSPIQLKQINYYDVQMQSPAVIQLTNSWLSFDSAGYRNITFPCCVSRC
jgi:hypothetical protein